MGSLKYVGKELDIFAHAVRWKQYFGSIILPYFGERVLEVGAGIGATTSVLCNAQFQDWICLEPDAELKQILDQKIQAGAFPACCRSKLGNVNDLRHDDLFDTIFHIDVLEHIENDQEEAQSTANHLNPNGTLIIVSPAHQWLFTPFDRAVGHYRRYSKTSLSTMSPSGCRLEKIIYLDSAGMLLSLANRVLLRQSMPTVDQIIFWDRWVIPVSAIIDRLLYYRFGKSIVGVWRKL
jgi:hypothetical protein